MASQKTQITKRRAIAVVGATAVFAIVSASAATLGGITSDAFGADQGVVGAPLTQGVSLTWDTTYDTNAGEYVLDGVEIEATGANERIDANAEVRIAVTGTNGDLLVEYNRDSAQDAWTVTPAASVVPADEVAGVSVVIHGGAVAVAAGTN